MTAKKSYVNLSAGRIALSVLKYGFLICLTVVALVPFVWMISSSLKTSIDVFSVPMKWIPTEFHWDNYLKIWERVPLLVYFKNTAVLAIIVRGGSSVQPLNELLHQYGQYIIGRMGVPYREKGVNIISVALDAPGNVISALSGKIGRLDGITAKTVYAPEGSIGKEEKQ